MLIFPLDKFLYHFSLGIFNFIPFCNNDFRSLKGIKIFTPLAFTIDFPSSVIPPYIFGPRNTASNNSYSSFNWPSSFPIRFGLMSFKFTSIKALSVSL